MSKRLILSVGREFGSGGHAIAEGLAKRFSLEFYDSNLLEHIAERKNVSGEALKKYDERPRNRLFSRTVRGYSNSMQENVANLQFDALRAMAEEGKSFAIVGRCSESILKGYDGLVSIFVLGDWEAKRERIMRLYNLSPEEAEHMMSRRTGRESPTTTTTARGSGATPETTTCPSTAAGWGSRARWTSWRPTSAPAWTPNAAQGLA